MKPTTQLHQLLAVPGTLQIPGAYDGASARVAHALGHGAVYLTGFGMEASILGMPDIGLASQAEIVTHAANIANAVPVPVIADADTGYGGMTNIHRTVRDFERAGIAGIHIEDQALPKRCGGMAGRRVVPLEEMVARLNAATAARQDPDFVIIARTDAKAEHGVDDVIRRLNAYFEVGADMAMIAEPFAMEELRRVCAEINGPLAMVGGVAEWPESMLSRDEFDEIGVKLVLYALTGMGVALQAQMAVYGDLLANGHLGQASERAMMSLEDLSELMGLSEWNEIEARALEPRSET
ncbi:MAG: isocitrate lyase/PEP mutase family protein [Alphaproteobacteria bacterium]|jgi:2-methylisocitrate lyase-like PEP mutase family enzyme|nr:carboxyvinyl-carboxyphosphonate phosphorylmutase [Rhodospirillaceae bacterium]MDP6255307.1 isocitrate lyase/PEP mutase family protein [Alphaproteobacteria bacterium]MDP7055330.1 isocitrate lyase/PEP mutase family protein [Alphaproteobacteria bacterium]MDP7229087.1 isocitrate lyase/PEP mutase family protein [Alphaproteobacteria bacterium]MDP7459687.1 isocitrate lyase/PEP mutase family protein [Alphaproteobacteria bacterium]|tara:strand:- start:6043 stop:6927 length:885 start_codon:yes stop_codon:yes gene_type:complete